MAVNKTWIAIAWLLAIAALPACGTGDPTTTTGSSSSSGSTSGAGGQDGTSSTSGGTDGGPDGSDDGCGDGKLAASESCDDANTVDGDGCTATCEFEKGWTCVGAPAKCSAVCGDGLLLGDEVCDDHNTKKGDGCNAKCQVEDGWTCDTGAPAKCSTVCGDGFINGKEQCDDSNTEAEDGCDALCVVELGYSCIGAPSNCKTQCGDGFITKGEDCDDDNTSSNDGCSNECVREEKWKCMGVPSVCVTPCGDGFTLGKETCDDANTENGDGCTNKCETEEGYSCEGEPSTCLTGCGDGVIAGIEKCDDGNGKGNDGCSVACKVEPGWGCTQQSPSVCTTLCGDGFPAGDEQCDDGNDVSGDGCDVSCVPEVGFLCIGIPSQCIALCGDGLVVGEETCDDLNTDGQDGCNADCKVELGWTCTTSPGMGSTCITKCGDGIIVGQEACDDGNTTNGDCCSAACQPEAVCEIEPNGEVGLANDFGTLSDDGLIRGSIRPEEDIDYYSLFVASGTTISLTADTIDSANSSCLGANKIDSTITLYDIDGVSELGSDDNNGDGNCSHFISNSLKGGPDGAFYYLEVKSSISGLTFDYALQLTIKITVCGNGIKETGEQCDDSNTANGDGCNSDCVFETYAEIEPNGTSAEADTNGAYPINSLWTGAIDVIGDQDIYRIDLLKTVDLRIETFDGTGPSNCVTIDTEINLLNADGTTVRVTDDDDGVNACSLIDPAVDIPARQLHPGTYYINMHRFFNTITIPAYMLLATPTALCGNGVKEGFEPCDGTINCSATCDIIPVCGDGSVSGAEQCDDGNTTSGDGCSSTCEIEGVTNETEPNNTVAEANLVPALTGNALIGSSIGVVGDKDIFKLDVATTSVIRFETFEGLNADCPNILTTLRLLNAAGSEIKIDTPPDAVASGIKNCAALVVRLDPAAYYIQVERTGNTSTIPFYLLQVAFETSQGSEVEPNDLQSQATALTGADVYVFGDHQVSADLDFYAVTVPAGKSIRAELIEGDATLPCEGSGMDSLLTLFNAAATQLDQDDDGGRGQCSAIDGTGAAPRNGSAHNLGAGTYFLLVKAFGTGANSHFNYNLVITVR
jgi:cysteine-rich repeat protein